MKIEVKNFRTFEKGPLKGFLDIYIHDLDWTIKSCSLFDQGGNKWVSMPSKQYTDKDGAKKYDPIIWMSKEKLTEFSQKTLKALEIYSNQPKIDSKDEDIPF